MKKNKIYKIAALVGIICASLLATPFILNAQTVEVPCYVKYHDYLLSKTKILLKTWENHFSQAYAATSLVPEAQAIYEAYKNETRDELSKEMAAIDTTNKDQLQVYNEMRSCQRELEQNIFILDQVYKDHVRRNTTSKRTYIITQQYDSINSQMGALDSEVNKMQNYFKTFNDKLPGFVPKCVQQ